MLWCCQDTGPCKQTLSSLGLSSNYPALPADWLTCCQGTEARLETSKHIAWQVAEHAVGIRVQISMAQWTGKKSKMGLNGVWSKEILFHWVQASYKESWEGTIQNFKGSFSQVQFAKKYSLSTILSLKGTSCIANCSSNSLFFFFLFYSPLVEFISKWELCLQSYLNQFSSILYPIF